MDIDDLWDDEEDIEQFTIRGLENLASPASVPEVSQITIAYTSEDQRFTFVATKHMADGSTLIIDEHVAFVGAEGCWVINAAAPSAKDQEDAERWRDLVSHQKFNNVPAVGYAINRAIERCTALKEQECH